MTRLVLSPRSLLDMEHLRELLLHTERQAARESLPLLVRGLSILKEHPLVGRKVESGLRELIIARGRGGYVALYDYDMAHDTAIVQALRHQREYAYEHDGENHG